MKTVFLKINRKSLIQRAFAVASVGCLIVFVFQNCGQTPQSFKGDTSLLGSNDSSGFDKNCLRSSVYDACLFFKNPTNTLSAVQNTITFENLPQQQIYGVKLTQLSNPQILKDNQIEVVDMEGNVAQQNSFRMPASTSNASFDYVLATQAYYWTRETLNFFEQINSNALSGLQIRVVPQAPVIGWSPNVKTIFLSSDDNVLRKNSALDATTITHLASEAIISHLTVEKIYDLIDDTNHKDCGPNAGPFLKNDCCKSKNGCSKAISAGIADYISAQIFPTSQSVGDYFSGDTDGSKSCSLPRNVILNKSLSFQQAYDSCASTGRAGQFYDMGAVLAAALNNIASQLNSEDKKQFHVFLVNSIQKLKGSDNFVTFSDLIQQESLNGSASLQSTIKQEFDKKLN